MQHKINTQDSDDEANFAHANKIERRKDRKAALKQKKLEKKKKAKIHKTEYYSSSSECDSEVAEKNDDIIREAMKFYALPMFVKPGKHHYMIKYKDTTEV